MAENRVGLIAQLDMDQFDRNYKRYMDSVNKMNSETVKTSQGINTSMSGLGASFTSAFGNGIRESLAFGNYLNGVFLGVLKKVVLTAGLAAVALVALGQDPVSRAADLEKQLSRIAAVLNMTNDQASFLKDVVMELGLDPTLAVTTVEAAQAIELLAKNGIFAGMSLEETKVAALDAGKAVVFLSNATGADFAQAANIASSAMTLFGLKASELVGIVSGITSVTTNSKFTIHDYELALRNGGAAAAAFGISLEDFNTVVATTADELGTGMKDGTSFANMLYRLTPNTNKAEDAMRELGLITADGSNIFFDAAGELKNVDEIAKILNTTFMGTSKQMVEVGGRTSAQNAQLATLRESYNEAKDTVAEYTTGVSSLLAGEDEKNKALEEANNIMSILGPQISGLEGITGDFVETTSKLTSEQRLMAIETIFGRDALGAVLGLMKEGEPIVGSQIEAIVALGYSHEQAAKMMANGMTEFELAQLTMSKTDAQKNAITRLDNLRGSMEKFKSVVEAVVLDVGYQFLEFLTIITDKMRLWMEQNQPLIQQVRDIATAIGEFFTELVKGEDPLKSFTEMLDKIGGDDLVTKFETFKTKFEEFTTPIITFVEEHSEEFIGALKAIGIALLGLMIAGAVSSALSLLISPVTLLIALVGGLGAAWETNFGGIRDIVFNAKDSLDRFLESLTGIKDFKLDSFADFSTIFDSIKNLDIKAIFDGIDWSGMHTSFIEKVGTLGEDFGTALNNIDWNAVGETLVTLLGAGIALAIGTLTIIGETLYTFLKGVFETTDWKSLGTLLWEGILEGTDKIKLKMSKIELPELGNLGSFGALISIGEKLAPVAAIFKGFFDTLKNSIGENLQLDSGTLEIWVGVWDQLKETLTALSPVFTTIIGIVGLFVGSFLTALISLTTGGLEPFIEMLGIVLTSVLQMVEGIADLLVGFVEMFIGAFTFDDELMMGGVAKMTEGITDLVSGLITGIIALFLGMGATIWEMLSASLTSIYDLFYNLYMQLVGASIIPDMVNAIITWIITLKDNFINYISILVATVILKFITFVTSIVLKMIELKTLVIAEVTELWTEFTKIVNEKTAEIWLKFTTFVGDILQIFTDNYQKFVTMGESIIDGLIAGISAKLEAAKAAILGVAEGVQEAWNEFWNTHSPSKLMMESGSNIMEGVGIGIQKEDSMLTGTMQNAATNMFGSFLNRANDILPSGNYSNPVQNTNNSSTQNITLNNSFAGNPQITDASQLELALAGYR